MNRKQQNQAVTENAKTNEEPKAIEEIGLDELEQAAGGSNTNHTHWSEWSKWN